MKLVLGLILLLINPSDALHKRPRWGHGTTLLKLKSFKAVIVDKLQPCNPTNRENFCDWIFQSVHDGKAHLIFFSNKAWFHLNGELKSHNSKSWGSHNLSLIHKLSLHISTIGRLYDVV
jgi:hypothetical protein